MCRTDLLQPIHRPVIIICLQNTHMDLWLIFTLSNRMHKNKKEAGASLLAQWLRICLTMQGTWVWAMVREDPTCRGATKPVRHNYWACALEPASHNYWACALEAASHNYWSSCTYSPCSATREATAVRSPRTATESSPHSQQLEKAHVQQWPSAANNK